MPESYTQLSPGMGPIAIESNQTGAPVSRDAGVFAGGKQYEN